MLGWAGMVALDGAPPNWGQIERMTRALARGGAQVEVWLDGPIGLGWRRRAGAPSPIHVDEDVVVLVDGVGWSAASDAQESLTGAVVEAWRRWGIDFTEHLEGDLFVAVWERKPQVLHLVRDRTGTEPVYWSRRPGRIAFAAELPAVLEAPFVSRELARDHLAEFLAFRVSHPPRTLMRDVLQLEPASRLRFAGDHARVTRWFTPRYAAPGTAVPREADVVPELNAAIERAVRRRLSTSVETGMFLSGGTGSTAVAAAARAASRSLKTFTVAFAEEPSPESPFAGRVARLLGMEHATVHVGSLEVADAFDDSVRVLGHPNGNAAVVLQLVLARAAALKVDRVITGDGADQLFGGRMLDVPSEAMVRYRRFHKLPSLLKSLLAGPMSGTPRFKDLLLPADRYLLELGHGGVELCDYGARKALLLDPLFSQPSIRREVLEPLYGEIHSDPLNGVMHAFFRSQLGADVLPRVDSTASAAGLDVAFPLLDPEVQRLAMLLPGAFKVRGIGGSAATRWLLRTLLRGALPPALINRPDRPMPRPLDDWLVGSGRLFLEERFSALRADKLGLWHHTGLEAVRRGLGRSPGAAHRLWALFILDAWIRQVRAN